MCSVTECSIPIVATIIYRLCQGVVTRRVKLFHLLLHTIIMLLLVLAIIVAYTTENIETYGADLHNATCWFSLVLYVIQVCLALMA